MSDDILLNDQMIWIVIFILYVLDNIKILSSSHLVLREGWNLSWEADLPSPIFTLVNRHRGLINPLTPYTYAVRLTWLTEAPNDISKIRRADRFLRVMKRKIAGLRCLSVVAFVTFFFVGPMFTYLRGLGLALHYIIATYMTILISVAFILISYRKFWQLSAAQIAGVVFECAVCPAYLVNITRKVSWNFVNLSVDGGAYALQRTTSASIIRLRENMSFALEELAVEFGRDELLQKKLAVYKAILLDAT